MNASAQLNTNEKPVSFGRESELRVIRRSANPTVTMPLLDMDKIEKEDAENGRKDAPLRFGIKHKVEYNLDNSGTWYEFLNGDRLWQMNVICPEALSVNFCYDKFWLPDGGKFFVYSKDKRHTLGAFTSKNNKGDREHLNGFATGLVNGSEVVLEYYQPRDVNVDAIISIEYVVHGYRYINWGDNSKGYSNTCMVDINCANGNNWQKEKKAIAHIILEGNGHCTGALVATTNLDGEPLLLTANHCMKDEGWDAISAPNLNYTTFYWNYEKSGCGNDSILPTYSTTGATLLANDKYSDFALLRLAEDPRLSIDYKPYYLGWDHSGNLSGLGYTCIHHPLGDVKKISYALRKYNTSSTYNDPPEPADAYWELNWYSGVTNPGSSGSPLLNATHQVIGQLWGGWSGCNSYDVNVDWFGKFSVSWTGYNNDSIQRRLNCWLDPLNIGGQTWKGLYILTTDSTTYWSITENFLISSTGQLTITSDVSMDYNTHLVVDAGGKLIIDGGRLSNVDLTLRPGAILQIKNEGILETRKGFKAPKGAIVDVKSGGIW
jgi:V8-like Glu-specific endopeptidase